MLVWLVGQLVADWRREFAWLLASPPGARTALTSPGAHTALTLVLVVHTGAQQSHTGALVYTGNAH